MNRKGFTLIELLAVIVVLGLVLLISVPIISDAYTKSKIKSEEVFVDRLTQAIDSYVKLNSDTMSFSCKSDRCEGRKTENGGSAHPQNGRDYRYHVGDLEKQPVGGGAGFCGYRSGNRDGGRDV